MHRVFVANRGEIAVRIIKACHAIGLEVVVGVSEADRDSLAARLADRAVCIGPPHSSGSYLDRNRVLAAAHGTGCDAVHPGYGFLSEDAEFAEECVDSGLTFVGPSPANIRDMGNKLRARALAKEYGVPLADGSEWLHDLDSVREVAERIGFPVLLKAAAGGGGRGIRIVREAGGLREAFEGASAEAQAAFGDDALFLERYIENARHIEVQVLADKAGNVIHLGERDCSLQRRYQKMLEEAPAFGLRENLRERICESAVILARRIGYESAGTAEFIVDMDRGTYAFLEMNTRVQVEHPITEAITGVDIIAEQLRIAAGESLSLAQSDVAWRGHAIEFRITTEAAEAGFRPSPGRINHWQPPSGDGIRLDSHGFEGYFVPPFYDSLLGKLIIHAETREAAIERARGALGAFGIEGVTTTIPFHLHVLNQDDFQSGAINTRWLETVAADYLAQSA